MMRQVITLSLLLIGLFAQSSVAQVMGNGFTPFFEGSGGVRFAVFPQRATALICSYFQQTMWITYEHQRSIETPSFFNLRFGIKYYYKH